MKRRFFSIRVLPLRWPRDRYHARAIQLAGDLKMSASSIITTRAVLLEIGAALAKVSYRGAAVSIIEMLESDPDVEIVPLQDNLFVEAFELFCGRTDKEWSLTDCISFVVMRQRGILAALAADIHFQQASRRCCWKNNCYHRANDFTDSTISLS